MVAFLGPAFAGLLGGSFVVETIFQIPGLGRFYVQAAFNRDYTMILGMTIFFATLIILFNLLSDMLAIWLNPKLRQHQPHLGTQRNHYRCSLPGLAGFAAGCCEGTSEGHH